MRKRTTPVHTDGDGDPLFGLDPEQALKLAYEMTPAEEKEIDDQLDVEQAAFEEELTRKLKEISHNPAEDDIDL